MQNIIRIIVSILIAILTANCATPKPRVLYSSNSAAEIVLDNKICTVTQRKNDLESRYEEIQLEVSFACEDVLQREGILKPWHFIYGITAYGIIKILEIIK